MKLDIVLETSFVLPLIQTFELDLWMNVDLTRGK